MSYKIAKEAGKDIEEIWLYTLENWSIEQADRYYHLLINEIEYLAKNSTSGKDCNSIRVGYFRSQVKSHLIFYKINRN